MVKYAMLLVAVSLSVGFGAEEAQETRVFEEVYLEKGTDGVVWIKQPLVYLGMVGVMAGAPAYRLSPALALELAPLTSVAATEGRGDGRRPDAFYVFGLPHVEGTLVVLGLETTSRAMATDSKERRRTYEVVAVKLRTVEYLTAEWQAAWRGLDTALNAIVAASLADVDAAKPGHVKSALSSGSDALQRMVSARETESQRKAVAAIAAKALVVHSFARRIAEDWGTPLAAYAKTLRIEPTPPLPAAVAQCPALDLLAQSATAAELVAKVTKTWGEEGLDVYVFHHGDKGWWVRDFVGMANEDYARVREEGRKEASERARWKDEARRERPERERWTLEAWGVELRAADPELLAKNCILRGTLVEKVRPEGSPPGLAAGDVIIDYESAYDIVMSGGVSGNAERHLESLAQYGRTLRVLRNGVMRAIDLKKR